MQLQKLRKHATKIIKNRQRLKCLSLGVILPPQSSLIQTELQISQKMINLDSCIHKQNNNQVLIVEFKNQIPNDGKYGVKINKLYDYFIKGIHAMKKVHQDNQEDQQKYEDIEKSQHNGKIIQNFGKLKSIKNRKQVAMITEQMTRIYEQTDKKHQIKRYRLSKMQKQIQKLYVESHQLYLQIMQIKSIIESQIQSIRILTQKQNIQTLQNTPQKQQKQLDNNSNILSNQSQIKIYFQKQSNTPRSRRRSKSTQKQQQKQKFKQKQIQLGSIIQPRTRTNSTIQKNQIQYHKLNNKINNLKQLIDKKQQQYKKITEQQRALAEQKGGYLKLLLKNGYHLQDGIWWFLVKLAQNNQKLSLNDFYDVLDLTTKQLLIQQYNQIIKDLSKNKHTILPKIKQPVKQKVQNKGRYAESRFLSLQASSNSLKVYKQTKNYIADWVRKQKWRVRSLKHKSIQQTEVNKDWINGQIKRLKSAYSKQRFEQIMLYVFGSTKYYHKPSQAKLQQFTATRRHKESLNSQTIRSSSKGLKSVQFLSRNNTNK